MAAELGPDAGAVPLPFVVGCNRSGTMLLSAMLDSHPDVAVPHESYFVVPALHRRAGFEGPDGVDRERLLTLLDRLLSDERVQRVKPTAEQLAMVERIRAVLDSGGARRPRVVVSN